MVGLFDLGCECLCEGVTPPPIIPPLCPSTNCPGNGRSFSWELAIAGITINPAFCPRTDNFGCENIFNGVHKINPRIGSDFTPTIGDGICVWAKVFGNDPLTGAGPCGFGDTFIQIDFFNGPFGQWRIRIVTGGQFSPGGGSTIYLLTGDLDCDSSNTFDLFSTSSRTCFGFPPTLTIDQVAL